MRIANSQKRITHNGIAMCVLYRIHTEKVRTNVLSESSKYITAKICNESHHCPNFVDFIMQENSQALLTVRFIKTFCLVE